MITRLSSSKERRIHWWIARLQAELSVSHATNCKCKACYAARQLRQEIENFNGD